MVNYKGSCVICNKEINPKYNYCFSCLKKERSNNNAPSVMYNPCELCLGEDCVCCSIN